MNMTLQLRFSAAALTLLLASGVAYASHNEWWEWSVAARPGGEQSAGEGCPIESRDGLSLYIASTRIAGAGNNIFESNRASKSEPFWRASASRHAGQLGLQRLLPDSHIRELSAVRLRTPRAGFLQRRTGSRRHVHDSPQRRLRVERTPESGVRRAAPGRTAKG